MARGREEGANSGQSAREELTKSTRKCASIVALRLKQLQEDNSKQIDKMSDVDENYRDTWRSGSANSFKLVSDRLEHVHQGLAQCSSSRETSELARRVLWCFWSFSNVERGAVGRGAIGRATSNRLLTPDSSGNVKNAMTSNENVEFAIKLPGEENGTPSGCDRCEISDGEDYHRLLGEQDPAMSQQLRREEKSGDAIGKSARKILARNT